MNTELSLFYLIRLGLGIEDVTSESFEHSDWPAIFEKAGEQGVLGIVFSALKKLPKELLPEQNLLLNWIGMAERIKQSNRQLNRVLSDLEKRLSADGWEYSVLKGQTIARLYPEPDMRQSGDIDVWLYGRDEKAITRRDIIRYLEHDGRKVKICYLHADGIIIDGVSVEVHFMPTFSVCPSTNRKLQKLLTPPVDNRFNLIYMMHHIYRHLFAEGISLKQVVDYAVILRSLKTKAALDVRKDIERLGMLKFAKGLVWILNEKLSIQTSVLGIEPNEREGRYILEKIMNRDIAAGKTQWQRFMRKLKNNRTFLWKYPSEVLWYLPFVTYETLAYKLLHR